MCKNVLLQDITENNHINHYLKFTQGRRQVHGSVANKQLPVRVFFTITTAWPKKVSSYRNYQ